jgi:branched-chain amino acid transport system substrate-binding protein
MTTALRALMAVVTIAGTACAGLAPQAAQTGPIKIGHLTSLTGNYTPLGTSNQQAVDLLVSQINAKGGIKGRQIELERVDDGSDPNQSVVQFNKLVDDGVVAVVGPPQSTAELAIKPVVNDKKVPVVAVGASDDQVIPVTPYMWMTPPLSSQVANTCLGWMKQQGKTKLAMLYDTKNAYANSGHEASLKAVNTYGLTLVDDETFETGQTNFAPQFAKIAEAKPDMLLVWATGAPPVVITKQWADAKTGIPLMMTAAEATPLYLQPAGAAAEGVYVQASLGVIGQSLPAINKFKKLIDEFAGPFQATYNTYPPQFAWDAMLAMTFIADAMQRKGTAREDIRAGLDSIDLDTPEGHYTFTPDKHYGMPDSANVMTLVKNGQFVPSGMSEDQLAKAGQ